MHLKSLTAFLAALTLCTTPLALAGCNDETAELPLTPPAQEETLPDGEETTPSEPSQPSQPSQPPQSSAPENSGTTEPAPKPEPEPTPDPVQTNAQYIHCTGNSVNIRSGAGTGYAVLGSAEKGTMYAITGKSGQWYKTYYRGKTAYLNASYAMMFELEKHENEKVENVVEEGYKLLGVPYVYGAVRLHDGNGNLLSGFTAQKFDCSSLVQYVFYKGAGKLLQVTTRTQVKQGKYVARSEIQRGDCLFFTNESRQHLTGVERVGHVALYLGDGYILHTASDYARIEKISAARWKFYIETRRFL